jgi:hypothetical protein
MVVIGKLHLQLLELQFMFTIIGVIFVKVLEKEQDKQIKKISKMENLEKLNLDELTIDELVSIQGGDKFMYDLGRLVGSWMKYLGNNQQGGF